MKTIKLVALHCLCADVFDGSDEVRPGGEALNFAAHAAEFENMDITLLGAVGDDSYGKAVLDSVANKPIDITHVRIDEKQPTAHNVTYLTPQGDRYYKPDSWHGDILENFVLNREEEQILATADVVFIHFFASCFRQVLELKKQYGFKLAVDFDIYRNFEEMSTLAPYIDFFMISGEEELLYHFRDFSEKYDNYFNMSLGEKGSVTYYKGREYRVLAEPVEEIIDTTGCGDSYHAGFVCSLMAGSDIETAMHKGSQIAAETLAHLGGF